MRQAVPIGSGARARALLVAALAGLIALTALVAPPGADAKPKKASSVPVKLMTRNLFLGADLTPALNSTGFADFIAANGAILREVDRTTFPLRARGLAAEIKSRKPDLVGLQEAALWRTGPFNAQAALEQTPVAADVKYDFLQLLLDELNSDKTKRYKGYKAVIAGTEFDFEAPADYDNNPATGLLGGEINGRLTMRDAILVRKGAGVKVKHPRSGHFQNLYTPTISGITIPVVRGWVSVDATAQKGQGKNKRKAKFRFVDAHFEAFDDETQRPSIRAQQASELLAGPAAKKRSIILGDFNSDVPGVKPGDEQAYQTLLDGGFTERSIDEPVSCCVSDLFSSPPSQFDHQVDHIMTNMNRRQVKLVKAEVTGREQVNGIYDSDHAGIFSKLIVR